MTENRYEVKAFARVERRGSNILSYWVAVIGGQEITIMKHQRGKFEEHCQDINKAADAHALKVGLKMLEMARQQCDGYAESANSYVRNAAQEISLNIEDLAAKIGKGEVVV